MSMSKVFTSLGTGIASVLIAKEVEILNNKTFGVSPPNIKMVMNGA